MECFLQVFLLAFSTISHWDLTNRVTVLQRSVAAFGLPVFVASFSRCGFLEKIFSVLLRLN